MWLQRQVKFRFNTEESGRISPSPVNAATEAMDAEATRIEAKVLLNMMCGLDGYVELWLKTSR